MQIMANTNYNIDDYFMQKIYIEHMLSRKRSYNGN